MILENILEAAGPIMRQRVVQDVVIGLEYVAVQLDDNTCGLAATIRDDMSNCCSLMKMFASIEI
ncbi:MAG: DUF4213 domain-containing protein [Chloroflexota bacterium]|nr:DUF4213 domain-containing protein [Chloroflexota bacterium]